MSSNDKSFKIIFNRLSLATLTAISVSACVTDDTTLEETEINKNISAPPLTMNLPVTLSGIVASSDNKSIQNTQQNLHNAVSDPSACEQYFDPHADFMSNGYSMTRFLVGLSQQQSCFADFIMSSVVTQGVEWINQGLISLPIDVNDPEAPSHAQLEQTGDTNQVWLFFATPGSELPADLSETQTLYLTWTGSGDDIQGQFFMANMPYNPDDPDAPTGIRVDFTRTASSASNIIFLNMREGHSAGMGGFRIDVQQTGTGANASYSAKGLITFLGQPFPNLPAGVDLPEFSAAAVVDAEGLGAATASFNHFAVSLNNDSNNDGMIDPNANEFDLGSYQFDISDTTYFDPALYDEMDTQSSYGEQVTEWRNKAVSNASYIADYQRIEAAVPAGLENYTMLSCLEQEFCDYNGNGTQELPDEWDGWNLGDGYFTNTCIDDATNSSDCNAFIGYLFEENMFGVAALNSTDPEPTSDWRSVELESITQLTSVHPNDDLTGASTFQIPDAPIRKPTSQE